jgi:hypothetical protein
VKEGFGRIAGHRVEIGSSKLQTRQESGKVETDGLYCLIVEEACPYCGWLHRFQLKETRRGFLIDRPKIMNACTEDPPHSRDTK